MMKAMARVFVLLAVLGGVGFLSAGEVTGAPAGTRSAVTTEPRSSMDPYAWRSAEILASTVFLPLALTTTPTALPEPGELPTVQLNSSGYGVGEGAGNAALVVTLSAASDLTVTVRYVASDGTAQGGADYEASSGLLVFEPGQTGQTLTIPVLDDALDETDETVGVGLSNPSNAVLGIPKKATLTIADDDASPTVQFSSSAYSVNEGTGAATIVATLSGASAVSVTVDYATSDGTAVAGSDYTAASGTLAFGPGETSKTFTVAVASDQIFETDETVNLVLSDPSNAALGTPVGATLTIVDNDVPPTLQFGSSAYGVSEGAGSALIHVNLSSSADVTVTVDYATSDGTATDGSDYIGASGTLSFPPAHTSQLIVVTVYPDAVDEADETVNLALGGPVNASLGAIDTATLTILDDDAPPTVQFNSSSYMVTEDGAPAIIVVSMSAASTEEVTVDYATADGTAVAGNDYTASAGTLSFAPGSTNEAFTVTVSHDTAIEPNETTVSGFAACIALHATASNCAYSAP